MPHEPRSIPDAELEFKASRSSGPGGQHVNTSSTRVEVRWNVARSTAFSAAERTRLASVLSHRIDQDGWIRVVASATRSQHQNRIDAKERLEALVAKALQIPKPRKATKTPKAAKERRLDAKRRRGRLKSDRRRTDGDD